MRYNNGYSSPRLVLRGQPMKANDFAESSTRMRMFQPTSTYRRFAGPVDVSGRRPDCRFRGGLVVSGVVPCHAS